MIPVEVVSKWFRHTFMLLILNAALGAESSGFCGRLQGSTTVNMVLSKLLVSYARCGQASEW